jgi:hypothetical protein
MDCFPIPPKLILPIPIETALPIKIIYQGKLLGTLKANSNPVIIAEPSYNVAGPL